MNKRKHNSNTAVNYTLEWNVLRKIKQNNENIQWGFSLTA